MTDAQLTAFLIGYVVGCLIGGGLVMLLWAWHDRRERR